MPEVFVPYTQTTLTAAITVTTRPITISVAATTTTFGTTNATFSVLIYDTAWNGTPATASANHVEAFEVTSGGGTLNWTAVTENGWTPTTHANGSIVVSTVLTPRSLQQQLVDHTTLATTPNPHSLYLPSTAFSAKGDILSATGSGTYTREAVGADGQVHIADSTQTTGHRWGAVGFTGLLTHMGDLVVGGLLGALTRFGIGTAGQTLTVAQNTAIITSPVTGPVCTAGVAGGTLGNGTIYDFAFAWKNGTSPDGGITAVSNRTTFTATSTGTVNVQAPAAPTTGLTLLVYAAVTTGTLRQSPVTLPNASNSTTNTIAINTLPLVTQPASQTLNTTGGLSPTWATPAVSIGLGGVAPGASAPADVAAEGIGTNASRTDHKHGREAWSSSIAAEVYGGVGNTGSATTVPRGDHVHPLPFVFSQSASTAVIVTSGVIATAGVTAARVSPATAVSSIILQAGTSASQPLWVINEAVVANMVTFAVSGTSNVADGVNVSIPGLQARLFVWDTSTSLWYEHSRSSGTELYTQSATSAVVATAGTITTSGVTLARVAPAGAVTGVILQAGTYGGQPLWVANESVAANTVTFAASATSNVADGVSSVIAGLTSRLFVWDAGTSFWYEQTGGGGGGGSGTVTSVALTTPAEFTVAGSPVSTSGTLAISKATQTANIIYAGPASGGAVAPTFRALVAADGPAMVASGASHAAGLVPDPGSTAGTSRYLREDATFAAPPSGVGGSGGTGVPIVTSLGSNVSIATPNTFTDGPSITLAAGTWFISGTVVITIGTTANVEVTAKLWNGTTVIDSADVTVAVASTTVTLSLSGYATLASSTAYKISATLSGATAGTILAATPANSAGNNASTLTGIPVYGYAQSSSAAPIVTSGTISTTSVTSARVAPSSAVTGVILQAGTYGGQPIWVLNESVAANTVTFAVAGTSNVADGVSTVVAGLTSKLLIWDSSTSLWYEQAGGSGGSGTVTSVALTTPAEFTVAGSPVTTSGTLAISKATQTANQVYAGPTSGGAVAPTFRSIVPADVPVVIASGASHAAGLVPDPGVTAGTTRFLREDATFAVPSGGGSASSGGGSGAVIPIQVIGPLTAAQAALTFSTIPQTGYRNLRIVMSARGTAAATSVNAQLQINGDTGANYDYLFNSSGTVSNVAAQTSILFARVAGNTAPASTFTPSRIELSDYANTSKNRDLLWVSGVKVGTVNTSMGYDPGSGWWRNSAAITSISLTLSSGNFDIGSYVCLYGEMDTAGSLLTPASNLLYDSGPLATTTATVTTPTLPQTYRGLRIEVVGRSTVAATTAEIRIQFNGDTGANYNRQDMDASVSTVGGGQSTGQTSGQVAYLTGNTSLANAATASIVSVPGYTEANFFKHWIGHGSAVLGAAASGLDGAMLAGFWASTAAITTVTIFPNTGSFAAGTTIRVYGDPAAAGGASVGTGSRMRISANQSATTGTPLLVQWDTEDNDADNQHYTSNAANTGTVAKTAGSNVLVGTGTAFTTELSVGQVISVPGTAAEVAVVTGITDATHLTVAGAGFVNTASGQTATRLNSPIIFRQPGFYTLETTIYSAALVSGNITLAYRLNGVTTIDQKDQAGINASAGYELFTQRQFQQWDYVEVLWTQSSGGSVNVLTDPERTHWSINARPTIIVAVPYVNVQEQQASGTAGGTFTSGAARTRTLNTLDTDTGGIASLASNQLTLPAGRYKFDITCPALKVNGNQAWLQNITLGSVVKYGTSARSDSTGNTSSYSHIKGFATFSTSTILAVQHQCATTEAADGFGPGPGFGTEVFTVAEFWKQG